MFFRDSQLRTLLQGFSTFETVRVLVCGGREFKNEALLTEVLDNLAVVIQISMVIHGDARGADKLAGKWAVTTGIEENPFPIPPEHWTRYRNGADPRRNAKMLRDGKPHLVVAFPGEGGTADMVSQSVTAGVPVLVVHSRDVIKSFLL